MSLSVSDLTALCQKYSDLKDKKSELEDLASEVGKELSALQEQIIEEFVSHEMPRLDGPFGTLSVVNSSTYRQPDTLDDKLKLFEYLKEQGLYEAMVKVDSRTLSSWATKEVEAKEREGIVGFTPPGLSAPHSFMKLSLRKKK
jgi:hypothetical protein